MDQVILDHSYYNFPLTGSYNMNRSNTNHNLDERILSLVALFGKYPNFVFETSVSGSFAEEEMKKLISGSNYYVNSVSYDRDYYKDIYGIVVNNQYVGIQKKDVNGEIIITQYFDNINSKIVKYSNEGGKKVYYYRDKIPNGKYLSYDESGRLKIEGQYFDSKKIGIWKEYSPNGKVKAIAVFEDNIKKYTTKYDDIDLFYEIDNYY